MAAPDLTNYSYPFSYAEIHSPGFTVGRSDQGVDFEAGASNVGAGILAIGSGTYIGSVPDPGGFGPSEIAYKLDRAPPGAASDIIFVGHSQSIAGLQPGDRIAAGQPVALVHGGPGYGGSPGHVEIGFGTPGNPYEPFGHSQAMTNAAHYSAAGAQMSKILNQLSTQGLPLHGGSAADAGSTDITGSGGKGTPVVTPIYDAGRAAVTSVPNLIRFLTSWRFAEIVGGVLLLIAGLFLVGRALGVSVPVGPLASPAGSAADAAPGPISQQPRRTQRRAGFTLDADRKPARGSPGSAILAEGDSLPY